MQWLIRLLSATCVALILVWMFHFGKGVSLEKGNPKLFNFHPIFEIFAFAFFVEGAGAFRSKSYAGSFVAFFFLFF